MTGNEQDDKAEREAARFAARATDFSRQQDKEAREARERHCQFVAIGVLLSMQALTDAVQEKDFKDKTLSFVVEALKTLAGDNSNATAKEVVLSWLSKSLGVDVQEDERLRDAVLRTVGEDGWRRRAEKALSMLSQRSGSPLTTAKSLRKEIESLAAELLD